MKIKINTIEFTEISLDGQETPYIKVNYTVSATSRAIGFSNYFRIPYSENLSFGEVEKQITEVAITELKEICVQI
ncbi:hypothetical protein Xsto_03976 [Xenorhabdus stockiae]|uniref:Uncharacterized protein n=1 Tax=Xenorhabdus stockiae TaxID=351614 RepID=A0A2D0KAT4_9GAMM|nr:hypothetical protein [Xenorhabdus stockiae]PHM60480.1 hypothetical protein Xsto_03976 [Xenorhabdus stockiae]